MLHEQLDGIGRNNRFIGFAFALSLLLHVSILFFVARDAARDTTFTLGFEPEPAAIDVRLIPAQAKQTAVAKLRPEPAQPVEQSPSPPARQSDGASRAASSPHTTIAKLVDLKTGDQLEPSHWQGAKIQGRPIKIRLTISPAGLVQSWEVLTPGANPLELDPYAMNNLVRNMDPDRTGETHVLIWVSQVGKKKNGELIARIYLASDE